MNWFRFSLIVWLSTDVEAIAHVFFLDGPTFEPEGKGVFSFVIDLDKQGEESAAGETVDGGDHANLRTVW